MQIRVYHCVVLRLQLEEMSNNNRQASKQVVFIETSNRFFQKRLENSFQFRAYLFHILSISQKILILINYSNIAKS